MKNDDCIYWNGWIDNLHGKCVNFEPGIVEPEEAEECRDYTYNDIE